MNAMELATLLSDHFLADGRFETAGAQTGSATAASTGDGASFPLSETGFSGLSIQAVGYEVDSEKPTVHIYVANGSAAGIKALSTEHDGILIKANRMAALRINPQLTGRSTNRGHLFLRGDRIACGSSCAPSGQNYSGTHGALVSDEQGQIYTLSNNHVLAACNHVPIGMPILSPSTQDSHPSLPAPREIGRHAQIVELRSGDPKLVPQATTDAAISKVYAPQILTSWQGDASGYDTPTSVVQPMSGLRVKKFGRTTALTTGTVEAQLVRLPLPYKTNFFSATVYFTDVWTVKADKDSFALPGDSGSLVVTEDGNHAVGLVFATTASASHNYGVIVTIDHVLNQLARSLGQATSLSLVSQHGI